MRKLYYSMSSIDEKMRRELFYWILRIIFGRNPNLQHEILPLQPDQNFHPVRLFTWVFFIKSVWELKSGKTWATATCGSGFGMSWKRNPGYWRNVFPSILQKSKAPDYRKPARFWINGSGIRQRSWPFPKSLPMS